MKNRHQGFVFAVALLIVIGVSAGVWGQATTGPDKKEADKKDSDNKDAVKKDVPAGRAAAAPSDPAAPSNGKAKPNSKTDRKAGDPFGDEVPEKGSPATKSAAKGTDDPFATTPAQGKLDDKATSKEPVDPFAPTPKKDDARPARTDPFGSDASDSKTPSKRGKDSDNPFEDKGEPSKSPDTKMPAETKTPEKSTRAPADLLSDTKSTEPEPTPGSAELKKGQELIDAGKYAEAIDPLKKAIKLAPTEAGPPYTLGVAYRMLNRYDDAIEELSDAIKLDAELGDAYLRRGVCWYNKGEFALAQADFEDAAGVNINDPRPLTWKGMTLVRLGHVREAANVYSEALRYDNHYAPAHINRGLAYVALKEYEKAIADFDEAIRSTPKDASLYFKRGAAQAGAGDWPSAIQSYSEAIRINPKYADAYTNRSLAYRRIGDSNKAQADAAKSQELRTAADRSGQSAAR
ncbi:MAG TPA: tetratricopeptide repeat protein [Pirellulales bacterium]|nr:tetratricopeptide repeat protein [Pirellulales bacterium]